LSEYTMFLLQKTTIGNDLVCLDACAEVHSEQLMDVDHSMLHAARLRLVPDRYCYSETDPKEATTLRRIRSSSVHIFMRKAAMMTISSAMRLLAVACLLCLAKVHAVRNGALLIPTP